MTALVVEFCGIPGAGKSTVCDRLVDDLRRAGHIVHQPRARIDTGVAAPIRIARKTVLSLAAIGRAPSSARYAVRIARAQARARDGVGRALQWLVTQRLLARRSAGITVLDEGLVQALWSAALHGDLERARIARAAAPDLIVVVECTPAVADARLRARGSEHSRVQERGDLAEQLARGTQLLEDIIESLPSIAPGATIRRMSEHEGHAVVLGWIDQLSRG